jgi:peptidoglycan hydrolase-like protein with peptidoglycan-binding domain
MRCNTGAPANNEYAVSLPMNMGSGCDGFQSPGSIMGGIGAGAGASSSHTVAVDTGLVRMIQLDLARLGYETGEADGVLSRPTVVAITQFEAANGLEVTGRATPQLAGRLQAAVSALN